MNDFDYGPLLSHALDKQHLYGETLTHIKKAQCVKNENGARIATSFVFQRNKSTFFLRSFPTIPIIIEYFTAAITQRGLL